MYPFFLTYYFSFAETRLHSRGGSSIFFRGAVGRRPVSLAQELHEGGDGSIGERDTLPDEFRAHRVSGGTKFACTWSRREIDNKYAHVCMCVCRNPNEGTPDVGPMRPERTKLKNIDWIAYETVHKKYLSIGEFARNRVFPYAFQLSDIQSRLYFKRVEETFVRSSP